MLNVEIFVTGCFFRIIYPTLAVNGQREISLPLFLISNPFMFLF